MLCGAHNYKYDFLIGKCPYCEAESRASAAHELAEEAARQRADKLDLDRAAVEQSERQHEEMQDALERQHESMIELEEQRLSRLEEMEEQRQRNHEENLERARLAKIEHEVEVLCRSSQRKLAAGRASEAQEDAERALDQDPSSESALSYAYFAAKSANRDAAVLAHYLERWVTHYVSRTQGRYQADSSTSDLLIVEAAAQSAPVADRLVRTLVDAYRSAPANLRDAVAKIGRPELLDVWLDVRLKRCLCLLERPGFPIESLLDAIAALTDGPAQISVLAEHLVESVGVHTLVAEWLNAKGHAKDAATYVRSCVNGPNAHAKFDKTFSEWLIANGYLSDASNYLYGQAAGCDAATRVNTLVPLGIETSRRMNAPTGDWISMLNTDLATLPIAKLSAAPFQSSLLSSATKGDVTAAMIGHLMHVISGPEAYRFGAGLAKATAGIDSVFSIRRGKFVERPLLNLQVMLIGTGVGLTVWLLPGGNFSTGITAGLIAAAIAWFLKTIYRYSTSEITASIIGKYCFEYCAVLERFGVDKRQMSAVTTKAPNPNPFASYATVLGFIAIFTAFSGAENLYSSNRLTSAKQPMLAGRTASGEWIQDWTLNANGNKLIARLYEEGEGSLILRGFDTSWSGRVSEDPRWTVQLTGCSTTKLSVSCAAKYSILDRQEFQNIPGRFDLDLTKRAGHISAKAPNQPVYTMVVHGTPSSLSGAPRVLLQRVGSVDVPTKAPSTAGVLGTTPPVSGSEASLPTEAEQVRKQLESKLRAEEAAARKLDEQEMINQRKVKQAAESQRRAEWEVEARSRYDAALAQAKAVFTQVLADARSTHQQANSSAQLESRQALAEAQMNNRVAQSAVQTKYQLAQQIAQKVPAIQATAQAVYQQEQTAAHSNYQRVQNLIHAKRQRAESEAGAVYQKAQADAHLTLKLAQAEAQKQYQIERENGPVQISKAPAAVAAPIPAPESAASASPQMGQDYQTNCKLWKPNLVPGESVSWSGACIDGYASGNGIARWSNGGVESLVYKGVFRSGVLQGSGVMIAAGGDRYEGDYRDGKRDGKGVYSTSAGQRYAGEFRENKKHGAGIVTDANGVSVQVNFRDGQQVH